MRKSLFGIYHPAHKISLLIIDVLGISLAFLIPSIIRLNLTPLYFSFEFTALCLIFVTSLFFGNGYTSTALGGQPRLPLNTFFVVLAAAIPATLFIYLLGPDRFSHLFGRGILPSAILIFGVFAVLNRIALNFLFKGDQKSRQVLVVGDVKSQKIFDTEIFQGSNKMTLQRTENLAKISDLSQFQAIVITPNHSPNKEEQHNLISARLDGIPIFSFSDFFESFLFLVPVNEINNDWFIRTEGFTMLHSTVSTRLKRGLDIVLASILLVLTLPICILTMLVIKAVSPRGPALFKQTRVGLQGQNFVLYKFRTMKIGSEDDGAQWAKANDDRIILFGRFLRKTRIDELPQCWNILNGEMSFIGPRPERPEFTERLVQEVPYYELRHIVKPGLTGWAQVKYPYGASVEDSLRKLQYDLYYIKNQSLILDLNILLRTASTVFQRTGR